MTVTEAQWAAAAAEAGLTLDELRAKVAEIDNADGLRVVRPHFNLPHTQFDRQGDPLTLGEWAVLFEGRSYRYLAEAILPNRRWIATIWQGINHELNEPPIVLQSGVFHLDPEAARLSEPLEELFHSSETEALDAHDALVRKWANS